ncbi:hypothetical protein GF319_00845 [Candidatus Bathyarchaeota archaeon]|nr:hypothetical protein [Candidatus Bathyarchaeota archaeon]
MNDPDWNILEKIIPGLLFLFSYYQLLSGLKIPFNFTVERITSTFLYQSPLLGYFELDIIFFALSMIYISHRLSSGYRKTMIVLTVTSTLFSTVLMLFDFPSFSYITLSTSGLASIYIFNKEHGVKKLLPGVIITLATLEMASLFSIIHYFLTGSWHPFFKHIVLKERLFWAPLEWISVLALVLSFFMGFSRTVFGRGVFFLPNLDGKGKTIDDRILLSISILLILVLLSLPHLPSVNPDSRPISVDTRYYMEFLTNAEGKGVVNALTNEEIVARPVYLITLFKIWQTIKVSPFFLMDFIHPFIALSLISLASFYTVLSWGRKGSPGLASLMVPLGYLLTGCVAGGFQSNSLALVPAILSISIEPQEPKDILILTLLWAFTGLIHPWTHLMYIGVFLAYSTKKRRTLILSTISAISSYFIVNIIDYLVFPDHASLTAIKEATGNLGPYFFTTLIPATRFWVWNSLSNPLFISLNFLSPDGIISSFTGALLPISLIGPAFLLYRILLNLPFHLNAGNPLKSINPKELALVTMILLVRVLGNLTGLTPLAG